jgi:hypothetical protein
MTGEPFKYFYLTKESTMLKAIQRTAKCLDVIAPTSLEAAVANT